MSKTKLCNDCSEEKSLFDFYRSKHDPSGRAPICRPCSRRRARMTNRALAILRDRHYQEYLAIRQELALKAPA